MWDHRNSVNNENETATMSIEVNKKITEEYEQGIRNLSRAARKNGPATKRAPNEERIELPLTVAQENNSKSRVSREATKQEPSTKRYIRRKRVCVVDQERKAHTEEVSRDEIWTEEESE
jgi:hypothetical protein